MSDSVDTSLLGICFCNNFFPIFRYQYTWLLFNKTNRRNNFPNLFCQETLHVSDSSSVHQQEFINCTLINGICHTAIKQDQDGTAVPSWSCLIAVIKPVWHIPVPNIQWNTPDDAQRNCPKHVEFLDKNTFGKLVRLLVLLKRNLKSVLLNTQVLQDAAHCRLTRAYLPTLWRKVLFWFHLHGEAVQEVKGPTFVPEVSKCLHFDKT